MLLSYYPPAPLYHNTIQAPSKDRLIVIIFQAMEIGLDLTDPTAEPLKQDINNHELYYTARENDALQQLHRHAMSLHRSPTAAGDKGSDSVYFTPSGTPMREVPTSPNKADGQDHYSAVYQQGLGQNCSTLPNASKKSGGNFSYRLSKPNFIKTHAKSRSFSFHMPGIWRNDDDDGDCRTQ